MTNQLFEEFEKVSSKAWKNQIQFELKGADYNETLVWESLEGIKVKPFYHNDTDHRPIPLATNTSNFSIVQRIYVFDIEKSIAKTIDTLNRGAEVIYFTIDNPSLDATKLLTALPKNQQYFFVYNFLDTAYTRMLSTFASTNGYSISILLDPIHRLVTDGNWYTNLSSDISTMNECVNIANNIGIHINATVYQNAGANMIQQLAYAIAHLNEYYNRIELKQTPIFIEIAVGTNYFFEIAKLRALRLLADLISKEYNLATKIQIIATPTKRNKTLYDYNVNMLRTTTECMSAVLGGADYVSNLPYDAIYHKENEFGDRISRNQLLILKQESYFDTVDNPAEGAYYIESLTAQLAEKALEIFKTIEKADGLITSLIEGTIQKKINESALKEQELFNTGKEVLLGTNKYPNAQDVMTHDLELFPFVKQNPRKTLIIPIIERRLAESYEQQRLEEEKTYKQ